MRTRSGRFGIAGWLALLVVSAFVRPQASAQIGTDIEVTNTNDSGPGSFRDAIQRANTNPGKDAIIFNIPGGGPHEIKPLSPLPTITEEVDINKDSPGTPKIVLDGSMAGAGAVSGLRIDLTVTDEAEVTISALVINNFSGTGVELISGHVEDTGIIISDLCIGTDVTGEQARPNGDGIVLESVEFVLIRNSVVSGNTNGVVVRNSVNVTIENSKVGSNAAGTADLGNTNDGVRFENSRSCTIKSCVVCGNGGDGVEINGGGNNTVQDSRIGTNAAGDTAIENTGGGLRVENSSNNTVEDNQISGNRGAFTAAVYIVGVNGLPAENNQVHHNIIGLNAAGTAALPNLFDGVRFFNAANNILGPGNRISSNGGDGVGIAGVSATGNVVTGNLIGTDTTGMLDLGNVRDGVKIQQGAAGNIVGFKIRLSNLEPRPRLPIRSIDLGCNVISGNGDEGVEIGTIVEDQLPAGNIVQGNLIGVTLAGNAALPNSGHGIQIGSTLSSAGTNGNFVLLNLISGNAGAGVFIARNANDNDVIGNFIGTRADGVSALGNGSHGVSIDGGSNGNSGNEVTGNTIASNNGDGVFVQNSVRDAISGNSIFSNGGLGIDLFPDGVTANDAGDGDGGANNLQNFPVINLANTAGGVTTVQGTINSTPGIPVLIGLHINTSCDASGNSEGQYPSASTTVMPDGSGNASFNLNISSPAPVPAGMFITATATGPDGNTSEFSQCRQVTGDSTSADLSVTKEDNPHFVGPGDDLTYTITVRNNGPASAQNVRLEDLIPGGCTFQSFTAPGGWTRNTPAIGAMGPVTCDAPVLAPGAEATFTLVVKVNSDEPGNQFILNRVIVSTATPDPNPANNAGATLSGTFRPPSIKTVNKTGDLVTITLDSFTCHTYRLQRSFSLAPVSFINIGSPQSGTTGTVLTFTDPNATADRAFYRVAETPE